LAESFLTVLKLQAGCQTPERCWRVIKVYCASENRHQFLSGMELFVSVSSSAVVLQDVYYFPVRCLPFILNEYSEPREAADT
jgi:hypothetical protein